MRRCSPKSRTFIERSWYAKLSGQLESRYAKTATLAFTADIENYSDAVGSAQLLPNGNYSFTSGRQGRPPNQFGQSVEVRPDGTQAYILEVDKVLYRSLRFRGVDVVEFWQSACPFRGQLGVRRSFIRFLPAAKPDQML